MDFRRERTWQGIVSGETQGVTGAVGRAAMSALSRAYALAYRRRMARLEAMPGQKLGVPVISVGNLVVGGTGKTPVCRWLAARLLEKGRRVGILTRGYGREGEQPRVMNAASPVDWSQTGDEPQLYMTLQGEIAIGIDKNRERTGEILIRDYAADVLLLDDAYQYVTLHRDWNILVLDAANPNGFGRLFPAGLLREPMPAAARADLFWFHRADRVGENELRVWIDRFRKIKDVPVVTSRYTRGRLRSLAGESPAEDAALDGKVVCVSGIANPQSFEDSVAALCGAIEDVRRFSDHHPFTRAELESVDADALERRASVVTTEKDAVRIPPDFRPGAQWRVLEVDIEILSGAEFLADRISCIADTVPRPRTL